ncbi:hypothetical protein BDQ17DRAFT_1428157 [Cyathus striatus]|nr:hypothetical protein BDQ17DRAFT_1428157 [Cyathus striatus]
MQSAEVTNSPMKKKTEKQSVQPVEVTESPAKKKTKRQLREVRDWKTGNILYYVEASCDESDDTHIKANVGSGGKAAEGAKTDIVDGKLKDIPSIAIMADISLDSTSNAKGNENRKVTVKEALLLSNSVKDIIKKEKTENALKRKLPPILSSLNWHPLIHFYLKPLNQGVESVESVEMIESESDPDCEAPVSDSKLDRCIPTEDSAPVSKSDDQKIKKAIPPKRMGKTVHILSEVEDIKRSPMPKKMTKKYLHVCDSESEIKDSESESDNPKIKKVTCNQKEKKTVHVPQSLRHKKKDDSESSESKSDNQKIKNKNAFNDWIKKSSSILQSQ